jgi:hypothetical protein
VQIIDVSTPAAPTLLGSYDTTDITKDVQVVGSIAYVAVGREGGLQIIDVSTPAAPTLLGSYDTPGIDDVQVVNSTAYLAAWYHGVQIIDVSTPTAPTLLGSYDTTDIAKDVQVVNSTAYVADEGDGVQIIDVSAPAAPTLLGSYDTTGDAEAVHVVGNLIYVADSFGGLQILRVREATTEPEPTPTPEPQPALELNHDTGKPGSTFVLSGSNFENTTTVSIAINGENVQEISISGGGFTLVIITSESAEPGVYRVTVTASGAALAQDASTATTQYTLDDTAPLREEQPPDTTTVDVPTTIEPLDLQNLYLPLITR